MMEDMLQQQIYGTYIGSASATASCGGGQWYGTTNPGTITYNMNPTYSIKEVNSNIIKKANT